MMNPELKAKWITDLKTHPKIQEALHDETSNRNGYCCLGVACITLGGAFEYDEEHDSYTARRAGRALNDGEGLNAHGLTLLGISRSQQTELINLNDSEDTFEPVIAWIEANL